MNDDTAPAWFDPADFDAARPASIGAAGAEISFRTSEAGSGPRILYVHGGRAHSGWWAPIVSLLRDDEPAWAAMDLSGHGDSAWRETYTVDAWSAEVLAVARHLDRGDGITLVGHSLGGLTSIIGAAGGGDDAFVRGIVAIDAVPEDPGTSPGPIEPSTSAPWYPTLELGAAEFTERSARSTWPAWLAEFVGRRSLRPADDGWVWRHDGNTRLGQRPVLDGLGALDVSLLALITGDQSPYGPSIERSRFLAEAGAGLLRARIADAGHDVMMEQPEAVAAQLRQWLAEWS